MFIKTNYPPEKAVDINLKTTRWRFNIVYFTNKEMVYSLTTDNG